MDTFVNDKFYATRNQLVEEISLLSDAQFNRKPDKDKWSIAQVCHHLVLLDERVITVISSGLKKLDSTQNERKEIHTILLDRTKKFIAPEIIEPSIEPFEVEQMLNMLSKSRKELMHPALGELPLNQWIELIYLHEQRHISQIKEIKLLCEIEK
ncbi:DinB family protein [Bacillus thuringiensis]|uniref:DinB family protein n=1 Tax=Bacillus thuringiensis TaxID=1428 RepID=UPI003458E464